LGIEAFLMLSKRWKFCRELYGEEDIGVTCLYNHEVWRSAVYWLPLLNLELFSAPRRLEFVLLASFWTFMASTVRHSFVTALTKVLFAVPIGQSSLIFVTRQILPTYFNVLSPAEAPPHIAGPMRQAKLFFITRRIFPTWSNVV